jgi:ribonuclease-3
MLGTEVQNVALYREAFSLKNSSKNQRQQLRKA